MTSIFSQDNTSFEKLSMDNMNISDRAIRKKNLLLQSWNLSVFQIQDLSHYFNVIPITLFLICRQMKINLGVTKFLYSERR